MLSNYASCTLLSVSTLAADCFPVMKHHDGRREGKGGCVVNAMSVGRDGIRFPSLTVQRSNVRSWRIGGGARGVYVCVCGGGERMGAGG